MLQSELNEICCLAVIFTVHWVTGAAQWTPDTIKGRYKNYGDDYEFDEHYRIRVSHAGKLIDSTLTEESERYGNIEITVNAFRETFLLDLKINTYMFASTYVEKSITESGTKYHDVNHEQGHCYYIGTVRDRELSTAAVSTCKGIVGYFAVGNVSYHIEPLSDRLHGPHVVYRSRGKSKTTYGCGAKQIVLRNLMNSAKSGSRLKRSFQWPQDEDKKDKVVEVYVANDKSQFDARGGDSTAVFQRAKDIVNIASSAYQPLGIYLVLVGMEVWTSTNPFAVTASDVDATLGSWYDYRKRNINPIHYNDNAILLTNTWFFSGVIGKAIIGTMCSNLYSGAVVSDVSSSSAVTGSTLAHNIGHNFGLVHDSDSCSCVDSGGHCIMYASSNPRVPATNWSSCSMDQFQTYFKQGLDICLYDVPQTLYQPTVTRCGNGIVEDGEECDCGKASSAECNSTCCNSTTCKLTATFNCAAGRCCDVAKCQIRGSGTICRQNLDDCDITEYCDGQGSLCPPDTHKRDGTSCTVNGNTSYCYDGQCRSHQSQCQLLWGPGTPVSNPICFRQFNVIGAHYGNCGLNWLPNVSYIPCAASDVMCGKLLCDTTGKNLYTYANYYLLSTASIGNNKCNSAIFDFGLKTQDPGLVPNGASCGNGMMCVSQKCVSSENVLNTISCDRPCDSNEICNNIGVCQSVNEQLSSKPPDISESSNFVDPNVNETIRTTTITPSIVNSSITSNTTTSTTNTSTTEARPTATSKTASPTTTTIPTITPEVATPTTSITTNMNSTGTNLTRASQTSTATTPQSSLSKPIRRTPAATVTSIVVASNSTTSSVTTTTSTVNTSITSPEVVMPSTGTAKISPSTTPTSTSTTTTLTSSTTTTPTSTSTITLQQSTLSKLMRRTPPVTATSIFASSKSTNPSTMTTSTPPKSSMSGRVTPVLAEHRRETTTTEDKSQS